LLVAASRRCTIARPSRAAPCPRPAHHAITNDETRAAAATIDAAVAKVRDDERRHTHHRREQAGDRGEPEEAAHPCPHCASRPRIARAPRTRPALSTVTRFATGRLIPAARPRGAPISALPHFSSTATPARTIAQLRGQRRSAQTPTPGWHMTSRPKSAPEYPPGRATSPLWRSPTQTTNSAYPTTARRLIVGRGRGGQSQGREPKQRAAGIEVQHDKPCRTEIPPRRARPGSRAKAASTCSRCASANPLSVASEAPPTPPARQTCRARASPGRRSRRTPDGTPHRSRWACIGHGRSTFATSPLT